jgi:uncharacterized protein (DUF952 family)
MKKILIVILATAFANVAWAASSFESNYLERGPRMVPAYKVMRQQEWNQFRSQGYFWGSTDDLKDGFIHLSPANQVERIIKKYFSTDHPVYIVRFDSLDFLNRLVWEPASNGELYPHLYRTPLSIHEMHSFEVRR